MLTKKNISDLKELSKKIRIDCIRMTHLANASHIASSLSMVDILAVVYGACTNEFAKGEDDVVIISKGHGSAAVYSTLAEVGIIDKELLDTFTSNGSILSGHVSHHVEGVYISTGSLGHGIGVAVGVAMSKKLDGLNSQVYTIIGDGECDEGSVWEAALFANHYKLSNLTVIIDHNKMQSLDFCRNTIDLEDLVGKWRSFGWDVIDIDGHSVEEIYNALIEERGQKPRCIVANTIKGKGVSFMENDILWHYRPPSGELYDKALTEIEEELL